MNAHVFYRPAGLAFMHHRYSTRDISLGGMRVFTDKGFDVGSRLELDVVLPGDSVVRCWAEVVWVDELERDAEARYDVGMRFTDMAQKDRQRLASVLG